MDNLNCALKRIKKKKEVKEAAFLAGAGKAIAGGAKAVGKAISVGGKTAAKAGAKGAKGAAKTTDKVAKSMKRPNIRSYKDPKTGKTNLKQYKADQKKYQDTKKKKEQVNPDPVENKKDDTKKPNLKPGRNLGDVVGSAAKKTKNLATKAIGGATAGFGSSSFKKESKISFQEFIDKIP